MLQRIPKYPGKSVSRNTLRIQIPPEPEKYALESVFPNLRISSYQWKRKAEFEKFFSVFTNIWTSGNGASVGTRVCHYLGLPFSWKGGISSIISQICAKLWVPFEETCRNMEKILQHYSQGLGNYNFSTILLSWKMRFALCNYEFIFHHVCEIIGQSIQICAELLSQVWVKMARSHIKVDLGPHPRLRIYHHHNCGRNFWATQKCSYRM